MPPHLRPSAASAIAASLLALVAAATPAAGQFVFPPRRSLEVRADALSGDVDLVQAGLGLQLPTGTYFRLGLIAAAGYAHSGGTRKGSARLEVQGRFHLDPYRQSRLGIYGIGGVVSTWDGFHPWEPRLVAGVGVELPSHGRLTWAWEAAFAGGMRIGAVLRRAWPERR